MLKVIDLGNDDAEKRLNESIKNAHKLRMESNQNTEIGSGNKPKTFQRPGLALKGPKSLNSQLQPPTRVGGSPLLEGEVAEEMNLEDLKVRHERLVDLILEEEDHLIAAHHKFIENTINSSKLQFWYQNISSQRTRKD